MMMVAKPHDWLSHLDQSLWLVVLLDGSHHASRRFICFLGSTQVGPIHLSLHLAVLPLSAPNITYLSFFSFISSPSTLSLPSLALCIYLITILSAACPHPRSFAFLLFTIFICLTFSPLLPSPGPFSQSSFTHNLYFLTVPSSSPSVPSLLPLLRNSFFLCMLITWRDGYVGPFIRHVFY